MTDGDLAKYIPKAGDRIAAVAFCRQANGSINTKSRKDSILARLKTRLLSQEVPEVTAKKVKRRFGIGTGNCNAAKTDRRVELGWMDYVRKEKRYKQVKSANGGGTRHLTIEKEKTVEEIKILAENLFFPNGLSKMHRKLSYYTTEIDCNHVDISDNSITLDHLYNTSKAKILRLYLCTKLREQALSSEEETETQLTSTPVHDLAGNESGSPDQVWIDPDDPEITYGRGQSEAHDLNDTLPWVEQSPQHSDEPALWFDHPLPAPSSHHPQQNAAEYQLALWFDHPLSSHQPQERPVQRQPPRNDQVTHTQVRPDPAFLNDQPHQRPVTPQPPRNDQLSDTPVQPDPAFLNDQPQQRPVRPQSAPLNDEPQPAPASEPWSSVLLDEPDSDSVTLIVRRGHCLNDMIKAFKDPDILSQSVFIKMRLPNGKLEEGEGSGVTRDCLTEFWTDFYERCTLGGDIKVPFIRHDYQCEEWQAVARILVIGWRIARYFPVKLAEPFLQEALYNTVSSSLKDAFLLYVSEQEREVLHKALDDFNSVDSETLLDALETHECHIIPTEENLIPLMSQLGHKALIQAPMYVVECWRPIVIHLASQLSPDDLHRVIQQKTPTSKGVKGLLQFPDMMNPLQTIVARYLKKYLGEIDLSTLQLFLRFCTGSNLMGNPIKIEFIDTSDFERRPQAHTCGCILKLPIGYHNYPDLRSDFNSVLTSSVWVMDIV